MQMDDQTEIGLDEHEALMAVKDIADYLRVPPSWVYEHADELGAYRLGKYLRFSLPRVLERLEAGSIGRSNVNPPTQRPSSTPTIFPTSKVRGTTTEQK
jgi:hypothetical protein